MSVTNDLYLVVLPLIHLGQRDFGLTEETLTLLPDKNFATEFFPNEVDGYISDLGLKKPIKAFGTNGPRGTGGTFSHHSGLSSYSTSAVRLAG